MNLRRHKLFLIFLVIVALLGTSVAAGAATIRVNTGKTFTFKPDTGGNTGGGTQQPNLPPEKPVEEPQKPGSHLPAAVAQTVVVAAGQEARMVTPGYSDPIPHQNPIPNRILNPIRNPHRNSHLLHRYLLRRSSSFSIW